MTVRALRFPCLALLLALPALAGDGPTFGVLAGLDEPWGELRHNEDLGTNAALGFQVGAQVQTALDRRNDLRAQLTFHTFPGLRWNAGQKNDYTVFQLAGDWVHALQGGDRHPFFLAGVSLNTVHVAHDGPLSGSTTQSGVLGVRAGGGYAFSRTFRLEGAVNQVMVKRNGPDGLGFDPALWVQGSAILTF